VVESKGVESEGEIRGRVGGTRCGGGGVGGVKAAGRIRRGRISIIY
jgi:hypothetical protein